MQSRHNHKQNEKMQTVTLSNVTYPKPPKDFSGMGFYYEKKQVATYETEKESLEEIEEEIKEKRSDGLFRFNWFSVSDETHPCGWVAGTI